MSGPVSDVWCLITLQTGGAGPGFTAIRCNESGELWTSTPSWPDFTVTVDDAWRAAGLEAAPVAAAAAQEQVLMLAQVAPVATLAQRPGLLALASNSGRCSPATGRPEPVQPDVPVLEAAVRLPPVLVHRGGPRLIR